MKINLSKNHTKLSLFLISGLISPLSFGQVNDSVNSPKQGTDVRITTNKSDSYEFVDEPAEYPGGRAELLKFLSDHIVYPKSAIKKNLEGKCYLQFVVDVDGFVTNVRVKRGVPDCPECDAEAVRVVNMLPQWKPGRVNGKPVNSTFSMPIMFGLTKRGRSGNR